MYTLEFYTLVKADKETFETFLVLLNILVVDLVVKLNANVSFV